jgi:hypothetical protein
MLHPSLYVGTEIDRHDSILYLMLLKTIMVEVLIVP